MKITVKDRLQQYFPELSSLIMASLGLVCVCVCVCVCACVLPCECIGAVCACMDPCAHIRMHSALQYACVCMCIHVFTVLLCVYILAVCTRMYAYACVCTRMHACACVCTRVCTVLLCACCICVHMCVCIVHCRVHVCMCMCVHACVFTKYCVYVYLLCACAYMHVHFGLVHCVLLRACVRRVHVGGWTHVCTRMHLNVRICNVLLCARVCVCALACGTGVPGHACLMSNLSRCASLSRSGLWSATASCGPCTAWSRSTSGGPWLYSKRKTLPRRTGSWPFSKETNCTISSLPRYKVPFSKGN